MSAKNNTPTVRRMLKTVFLTAALGFGIKALLLHPLFIQLASNVAYQNTWYTNILYYLIDGGLIDLAVFAVCTAIELVRIHALEKPCAGLYTRIAERIDSLAEKILSSKKTGGEPDGEAAAPEEENREEETNEHKD